ncbi:MAG: (d)CMP kinase [Actinomycetota bacterium]
MNTKTITIDGPAGSGKSTIAKILARELGLKYIDTGAMYRAVTLLALEKGVGLEDEEAILDLLKKVTIELDNSATDAHKYTSVKIGARDVTDDIRGKEVGAAVSIVSKLSGVRKYLVSLQREMAEGSTAVLEGRDTGSVVFPDAMLKIYLTASLGERINRRKKQLLGKGQTVDEKLIKKEIIERDRIDSGRKDSPLMVPENGIKIDTTGMGIREVVGKIKKLYHEKLYGKN